MLAPFAAKSACDCFSRQRIIYNYIFMLFITLYCIVIINPWHEGGYIVADDMLTL